MKVLISGASGLIGSALSEYLKSKGHSVKRLVRKVKQLSDDEISWNPAQETVDASDNEFFDAVVNLSGENIASRWNEEKKKKLFESRIKSTRTLCLFLAKLRQPPKVLVNASAVGYYGNKKDVIIDENSPSDYRSFLANLCREWESATGIAQRKGIRVVCLRNGVVLTTKGGALAKMLVPFKMGFGGIIGSGEQYISWITLDDLLNAILFIIENPNIEGPVNAVSPNPVTNREFTKTLGDVLHRPTVFSLPAPLIRIILGEMADETLLTSTRAIPRQLEQSGFNFQHPELKEALTSMLS